MRNYFLFYCSAIILSCCPITVLSHENTSQFNLISDLLHTEPQHFGKILANPQKYRVQIIYTQIDRNIPNSVRLTTFTYRPQAEFYYPASLVKLPVAALVLEKIHQLAIPQLNKETGMITEADYTCQTAQSRDNASPSGLPTIETYIKRVLIMSDNKAYNRLYEFLGQQHINQRLWAMSYHNAHVLRRLDPACDAEQNRYTNAIRFVDRQGNIIYKQAATFNKENYIQQIDLVSKKARVGKITRLDSGKVLREPMDFSEFNFIPLTDLHHMLISIILPEAVPQFQRFQLNDDDYAFLRETLATLPRKSDISEYQGYPDNIRKFLLLGNSTQLDKNIRIFNKVGLSYGFISDVAYILDETNHIEFFLSATLFANDDEVMNDNHYEYDTVGKPFMEHLGKLIYQYEKQRKY